MQLFFIFLGFFDIFMIEALEIFCAFYKEKVHGFRAAICAIRINSRCVAINSRRAADKLRQEAASARKATRLVIYAD
jgi:hypothetical protein